MTNTDTGNGRGARSEVRRAEDGAVEVRLGGDWTLASGIPSSTPVLDALRDGAGRVVLRDDGIGRWDSGLLVYVRRAQQVASEAGADLDVGALPAGARRLLDLAAAVPERRDEGRAGGRPTLLARVGGRTLAIADGLRDGTEFVGAVALSFGRLARGRASFRRTDLGLFLQDCGAKSLPIVTLISLLVGLILAFVGAIQLRMFGAQIFVADLVGLGMAVEMGALMTGIIMSGRIGAAYAAQLGTMQVNEEIDALKTMGLSPYEFLVLPRVLALVLMMPLLCLYANFLGMIGGAIVGIGSLGLDPVQYFHQTKNAVELRHFAQGLIKAFAFGVLVALAGCYRGLRCGRSASAVGDATTAAVVTCIVLIVVADALLTIIYTVTGF